MRPDRRCGHPTARRNQFAEAETRRRPSPARPNRPLPDSENSRLQQRGDFLAELGRRKQRGALKLFIRGPSLAFATRAYLEGFPKSRSDLERAGEYWERGHPRPLEREARNGYSVKKLERGAHAVRARAAALPVLACAFLPQHFLGKAVSRGFWKCEPSLVSFWRLGRAGPI